MIFVSTGGRPDKPAWETASEFASLGIRGIELSGGKSANGVLEGILETAKVASLQPHNYFPPPKDPFVLNLASQNEDIWKRSIAHVQNSIDLAFLIGAKTYSFHAGYLVDPEPSELGKRVVRRALNARSDAVALFVERCKVLSRYAKSKGIRLLIENNVLSHNNYREFGVNPFLMVDKEECIEVMSRLSGAVGLLVDVAHLKVSANTLGFDKKDFLAETGRWIESYHLSDNDGLSDSNSSFDEESWFWPYLKPDVEDITIEVYSSDNNVLLNQYYLTMERRK